MIPQLFVSPARRRLQRLIDTTRSGARHRLRRLFLLVLLVVAGHTAAMMAFEGMGLGDALWLTFTSITTVGYGDLSAAGGWGRLATVLLIYLLGIWLLAQMAAEYLDFRMDRRERMLKGDWRWIEMRDHLLIINTPVRDSDRYLQRLIEQLRETPALAETPVLIATTAYSDGLPAALRALGVVHQRMEAPGCLDLEAVNAAQARYVLVLAEDPEDARSDSLTYDALARLQQHGSQAYTVAECVLDANKERFPTLGADAVMRPIRAYPELVVRELAAPGTEQIIENLFTHQGDTTQRYDVELANRPWAEVACALIRAGHGTPLGYVDPQGAIVTNPPAAQSVRAKALILVVREDAVAEPEAVRRALDAPG